MKPRKSPWFALRDLVTERLEFIAFSGLGLAGAVLITAAIANSLRFAGHREEIIRALSAPATVTVEVAPRRPNDTNLVRVDASQAWVPLDAFP